MQADILREKFLDFFKGRKHKIVESDSLVPAGDPTVLFTPAGMNQFKKQFLGHSSGFTRAATAQRCLRTDDLDKVGVTCGHHTFFEMLGNFSFGDYFKEEAIIWAWEFLTEELKIEKDRLWVSVYKDDNQAYKVWKDKIRIPQGRIIKLGDKENFWPSEAKAKGPNGPCGPCSEIFFDQGNNVGCAKPDCSPACDCERFVEVWNLVFTQFNRKETGILEPLPKKNIDTGMGLERLAAVMQGVKNNFETDLFKSLIKEIVPSTKYQVPGINMGAVYAVADHIRAIVFAIYDGVLPSNEGRGYVVRKIIRKSVLHLQSLGIKQPFLYKLVPVLSEIMKKPYPQLDSRRENISEIILAEEKSFIKTLDSSDSLLEEIFGQETDPESLGKIVFRAYDTHGVPPETTMDWLDTKGLKFSEESFNKELEAQKQRSKSQSAMKGDVFNVKSLRLGAKETKFLGYKACENSAKIIKIIKDGTEVKKIIKGDSAEIILDKTSFYGESGGQIGDNGQITKGKNVFGVLDTKRFDKITVHIGEVKEGTFKKNDAVKAKVNLGRRLAIARNHTATHLLQAALREILGQHVQQQGSLVAEDRLRFDFTHFKDIDRAQLNRIEERVNNYILNNHNLSAKQMPLREAKKKGALAFFGEKYESKVRVVSVASFSQELCAGTHLDSTGQIGLFKITQEGSVARGIRRIEAVTGNIAYKMIKDEEKILDELSLLLNTPKDKAMQALEDNLSKLKMLEKQLHAQKIDDLKSLAEDSLKGKETINGISIITKVIAGLNMDLLRRTVDLIKQKLNNAIICVGSSSDARAFLVIGVTEDLCLKGIDASGLILKVSSLIGGSGGGRKDFAQAGGNKPENFQKLFQELRAIIANLK